MENLDSFWPYMIHLLASFLYFFLSFTEKLDGLPEAGLRRFMRMTRNPLKNHSNKEFEKKLYDFHMKVCGWYSIHYIYFTFSNAHPNYCALFWIKKVQKTNKQKISVFWVRCLKSNWRNNIRLILFFCIIYYSISISKGSKPLVLDIFRQF